jgi:phosphomannomutase/phosphoglucomutase
MTIPINARLFKKYDIRGQAMGDNAPLTPEVAQAVGQAYGTHLQRHENINQVVVGRDNRTTSVALQTALMNGLSKARISVVDLGLVATPVVYWHAVTNGDIAGVMITGSHLAADQNGFKLCIGARPFYDQRIQDLRQMIDSGDLIHGDGDITVDHDAQGKYIRDLSQRIPASHALRVVLDAGNGVGGIFAPDLVKAWGHEVLDCMYCEPDSNFPNHHPNPQEPKNMIDLGNRVRELNADVGIAFDGDSDRMGAVDENGEMIAADRLLALMAQDMLKRRPGASVVADVLCSQVLFDAIESAGGHGYMAASGHSMVKDAMREKNALLGGEMSGHIFLGEDYFGYDDGFFAAGRLLQRIAESGKTLAQLNADLPTLYATPEYRPHCPDDDKQTVIVGVAQQLAAKGDVETVDGFRIKFENGWGILRASNTEPVLSLRFEGKTEADALAYRDLFAAALKVYPQVEPLE